MIKKLKRIYEICFNDSKAYTDFAFKNKYILENALYHEVDGQPVSELFIVEKKIIVNNIILNCPYLCGVCTLPEYRKNGYAQMLIEKSFQILKEKGYTVCALHPFEHSFYENLGFVTYCKVKKYKIAYNGNSKDITLEEIGQNDINLIKSMYEKFMLHRNGYVYRNYNATLSRYLEMKLEKAVLIMQNNKPAGYAYYNDDEVEEYCASADIINNIKEFDNKTVNLPLESSLGESQNFTMIKILDRERFLKSLKINSADVKSLDDFKLIHTVMGSYNDFNADLSKEIKDKYLKMSNYVFDKY